MENGEFHGFTIKLPNFAQGFPQPCCAINRSIFWGDNQYDPNTFCRWPSLLQHRKTFLHTIMNTIMAIWPYYSHIIATWLKIINRRLTPFNTRKFCADHLRCPMARPSEVTATILSFSKIFTATWKCSVKSPEWNVCYLCYIYIYINIHKWEIGDIHYIYILCLYIHYI